MSARDRALSAATTIILVATLALVLTYAFIIAPAREQAAFDRGMKAGVEYQTWFCENPAS